MANRGAELCVDLFELHKMATVNLPAVATEYGAAAARLGGTEATVADAFSRPSELNGPHGSAYRPWREPRDTVQRHLKDTQVNLDDSAAALLMAVKAYAAADGAAGHEFRRLLGPDGGLK